MVKFISRALHSNVSVLVYIFVIESAFHVLTDEDVRVPLAGTGIAFFTEPDFIAALVGITTAVLLFGLYCNRPGAVRYSSFVLSVIWWLISVGYMVSGPWWFFALTAAVNGLGFVYIYYANSLGRLWPVQKFDTNI